MTKRLKGFQKGHNRLRSLESYRIQAEKHSVWNKGLTKEQNPSLMKISLKSKGKHNSQSTEFKKGHINLLTEESKRKISKSLIGNKHRLNHTPWNKGKTKEEFPQMGNSGLKDGQTHEKSFKERELHPNWKGGTSFEPYTYEFIKYLRFKVRERDGFVCQKCFIEEEKQAHDIHHIDGNKYNDNLNNLITLCKVCHNRITAIQNKQILECTILK